MVSSRICLIVLVTSVALVSSIKESTASLANLLTVSDYEKAANLLLPVQPRDYYNGGSEDEVTLRENTRAYQDYIIRPFVLRNASALSISTSFLSSSVDHPIGISPTAFHKMAHPDGELGTVRGAKASKSLMIASSFSTYTLEDIKNEAGRNPMWLMSYIYKDRALAQSILRRAETAGYSAIVLSVDIPITARRLAVIRDGFVPAEHMFANFANLTQDIPPTASNDSNSLVTFVAGLIDDSLTWDFLKEFTSSTSLPVIVKGVLRAEDAVEAVKSGVKGIIVSNHGGRQIDSGLATINAIRDIAAAVKVPVWMDGGIRNGRDIFKALALGATGVFVGRPVLWGLTVAGEAGVAHVMNILREELENTMKLAGCTSLKSIRAAKDVAVHKSFFERH